MNNPKYILIHCTDYSYRLLFNQLRACDDWHKDRDFTLSTLGYYVGYHRLITGDKNYKTREDGEEGCHCNQKENGLSLNLQSLGVCVGCDGDVEFPTSKQYELLQKQVWDWQDTYKISDENVRFHRYYTKDKTCPGSLLTAQWLQDLLKRPLAVPTTPKENSCTAVVNEQKQKIKNLQDLVKSIINNFKIK